jgi:hypothetical protein
MPDDLQNFATKDLATKKIEEDLLEAAHKGQEQLNTFVQERLLPCDKRKTKFRDPLRKNKPLTFSSIFEIGKFHKRTGKEKAIKADRKVLQRLITAYEAGRNVDLSDVMTHELSAVPQALAEMNGSLRTGSKAILAQVLTETIPCPPEIEATELGDESTLIIDGQALVIAIGKPKEAATFGDLADVFVRAVLQGGASFHRVDVLFDRYYEASIKGRTRERRGQGSRAIRRLIEGRDVPLPSKWESFMAHPDNKADLARFISQQLMLKAPTNKIIVVAGGFSDEERAESSDQSVDTDKLEAKHEEADTRMILHCVESSASSIVVAATDTDVLVLLLAHFHRISCNKVWLKAGTAKKRKYIPIHAIVEQLSSQEMLETLPAFHALTGSDTTSYLAGHSKKTCWKVFRQHHGLLKHLGEGNLDEDSITNAELFICKVYNIPHVDKVDKARSIMFTKAQATEKLPPTTDALSFHIKRTHYQALVWRQAHIQYPKLPPPETMGWKLEEASLVPILMSLPPIPESCMELITCNCTTRCMSALCKCKKSHLPCTRACKCRTTNDTCSNG